MARPRFRILGGQRGPNSQQAHNVVTTSHRRHVPTRFLINQCQIITFLILKSDNKGNSRIELRGIVLPVPSNQIKITSIIILPSTWYICDFFLFHIEIEGKCGWTIRGGGGGKGYVGPPLSNYWGAGLPPPPYYPIALEGLGAPQMTSQQPLSICPVLSCQSPSLSTL